MRYGNPSVRLTAAWVLSTVAIYAAVFGVSTGNRLVVALSGALLLLSIGGFLASVRWPTRRRSTLWVAGTAEVVTASPPPESGIYDTCDAQLNVVGPGLPATLVTVRDRNTPVAKWPRGGETLPVVFDLNDRRRLRIEWDAVPRPDSRPFSDDPDVAFRGPQRSPMLDGEPPDLTEADFATLQAWPPRLLPLEEEPSLLVARYLFPSERYRGEWRRHYVRPTRRYVAVLALAVLGAIAVRQRLEPGYVTGASGAISAAGGLLALYALASWQVGRLALTQRRLILIEGVLRRRVTSVTLNRLADLRFDQSATGRLLNYGDFGVEGTSWFSRMRRIADLPNPNELYLRLTEEAYDPHSVEARLTRWSEDDDD